jgi:hypothetical protein
MSRVKGTVTRAGKGKFSYFVQLDGDDFYYNTKFEPKCGEGDVVGIDFEKKGPSRGQINQCKVLEDNSGGYQASNSEKKGGGKSFSSGSSASGKTSGGNNRNESIVFQHSQEMAIRSAEIILAQEAYAVKGKADAKYLQVEALIDQLTVKFYEDALDPEKSNLLKEYRKIKSDAGGDGEEGGDWDGDEEEKSEGDGWDDWS